MRIAAAAPNLGPKHAVASIFDQAHAILILRLRETRPARSRVELRVRSEELVATAGTPIHAILVAIPVLAREGALCATLTADLILLGREFLAPLGVGFRDLLAHSVLLGAGGCGTSSATRRPSSVRPVSRTEEGSSAPYEPGSGFPSPCRNSRSGSRLRRPRDSHPW